jgi:hypothetical protein
MKNSKMIVSLGAFVASVAAPNVGVADDNCSGHYVQVETTIFVLWNDPVGPAHMAVGQCVAGGQCMYKDKDGDGWVDQSSFPRGGSKVTWRTVSGTGMYVSATENFGWVETKRTEFGGPGTVYIGA